MCIVAKPGGPHHRLPQDCESLGSNRAWSGALSVGLLSDDVGWHTQVFNEMIWYPSHGSSRNSQVSVRRLRGVALPASRATDTMLLRCA